MRSLRVRAPAAKVVVVAVPESDVDPAQIIAWAIVLGYAQQLFTRLVDQQAHVVLDDVGGSVSKASPG